MLQRKFLLKHYRYNKRVKRENIKVTDFLCYPRTVVLYISQTQNGKLCASQQIIFAFEKNSYLGLGISYRENGEQSNKMNQAIKDRMLDDQIDRRTATRDVVEDIINNGTFFFPTFERLAEYTGLEGFYQISEFPNQHRILLQGLNEKTKHLQKMDIHNGFIFKQIKRSQVFPIYDWPINSFSSYSSESELEGDLSEDDESSLASLGYWMHA
jgi:hypothetical protein